MAIYVLVHGAWQSGPLLEPTAALIRAQGHEVFLPTLAGNRPGDSKHIGLEDAVQSLIDFFVEHELNDVILVGHSYSGMVITGVADRIPDKLRRVVYWNAFVPNDGESLNDLAPPLHREAFEKGVQPDGGFMLPFEIWRENFLNDAPLELARSTYEKLNSQPWGTLNDPIRLSKNPAEMDIPKSYLNCTEDIAMPHSMPWHPRLSEKLGFFRLIQAPGSHELCFSSPELLAKKIVEAGRD
jgi:pimeloyl-ACP methyl ester carboxylesterase